MRVVNKEKIVLLKRRQSTQIGSIVLPDSFTVGSSTETSGYRIAELISGPDHIPLGPVIVAELGSHDLDLKELVGEDIHRAPVENILGYVTEEGAKPLLNLVMVKPDEKEEKISGTMLIMPDCSKRPTQFGTVISTGPDVKEPELKAGARVCWSLFAGLEVPLEKEGNVIFLREEPLPLHSPELLAIVEESNE